MNTISKVALMDNWPGHLVVTDAAGHVLVASAGFRRLLAALGLPGDERVPLTQVMTPASRMLFETTLLPELLGAGALQDTSLTLLGPDGGSTPVMVAALRDRAVPDRFNWILLPAPRRAEFERELVETRRRLADVARALGEANQRLKERQSVIARQARELEERNLELERLASHDPLSGLLNRRGFLRTLDERRAKEGALSGAILLLDLDHFKHINDTLGHAVGDEVIRAVAGVLSARCRERDAVARFGGEEFVIWCPDVDAETAVVVGERIRAAVEALRLPDWPDLRVTVSVGVAPLAEGKAIERILSEADAALYRAKADGRNRVQLAER